VTVPHDRLFSATRRRENANQQPAKPDFNVLLTHLFNWWDCDV